MNAEWNRALAVFNSVMAAGSWPMFADEAMRDWTLIIPPLVITCGVAVQWYAIRKVHGSRSGRDPEPRREAGPVTFAGELSGLRAASCSMADMELGAALVAAVCGPCSHPGAVPVDLLLTGETVAWLCPGCDARLPVRWGE